MNFRLGNFGEKNINKIGNLCVSYKRNTSFPGLMQLTNLAILL